MAVIDYQTIRVLLADDHGLLRRALVRLIESFPGMEVVGEAAAEAELLSAAGASRAHVALIDGALPNAGGIEAAGRLLARFPGMAVIVMSVHGSNEYGRRAIASVARGFVGKDTSVAAFEQAIRRVSEGEQYFPPSARGSAEVSRDSASLVLTRRQHEVLALVVDGYRTREIAERLSLSVKTIESHRAQIMRRLGVRHLPGLIRVATKLGLVRFDED